MTKGKAVEQTTLIVEEPKQETKTEVKDEVTKETPSSDPVGAEKKESDPVVAPVEQSLGVIEEESKVAYLCRGTCQLRIEAETGLIGTANGAIRNYSAGNKIFILPSEAVKLQKGFWEKF